MRETSCLEDGVACVEIQQTFRAVDTGLWEWQREPAGERSADSQFLPLLAVPSKDSCSDVRVVTAEPMRRTAGSTRPALQTRVNKPCSAYAAQ